MLLVGGCTTRPSIKFVYNKNRCQDSFWWNNLDPRLKMVHYIYGQACLFRSILTFNEVKRVRLGIGVFLMYYAEEGHIKRRDYLIFKPRIQASVTLHRVTINTEFNNSRRNNISPDKQMRKIMWHHAAQGCTSYNWASACDFQQCDMWDQQSLRSACAYAQSDQSLCLSLEYSMTVKLLTDKNLEFLSLKGGCTGSSESTLVKMSNCWKSHDTTQLQVYNDLSTCMWRQSTSFGECTIVHTGEHT